MTAPRPDDVVLGGQSTAPLDAAVLGGIEGIKQRFDIGDIEEKKQALEQALQYGELGINFLFNILDQESNYDIHIKTYHLLLSIIQKQNDNHQSKSFFKKLIKPEKRSKTFNYLSKEKEEQIKAYLQKYKELMELEKLFREAEEEKEKEEKQQELSLIIIDIKDAYSRRVDAERKAQKAVKKRSELEKKAKNILQLLQSDNEQLSQELLDEFRA